MPVTHRGYQFTTTTIILNDMVLLHYTIHMLVGPPPELEARMTRLLLWARRAMIILHQVELLDMDNTYQDQMVATALQVLLAV